MRNNAPVGTAGGNISVSRFVKPSGVADNQWLQGTSGVSNKGDACVAISQIFMKLTPGLAGSDNTLAAASGDPLQVYAGGDPCELLAEPGTGGFAHGDFIKSGPTGGGLTALTGDIACAYAQQTTAAGFLGLVVLITPKTV